MRFLICSALLAVVSCEGSCYPGADLTSGPTELVAGHSLGSALAFDPASGEYILDLGCGGITMRFVRVPAGVFRMGSSDGEEDERPPHEVTIGAPFLLGKHEVTQEQWECVMKRNPSRSKGFGRPVENVDWHECQEFAAALEARFPGGGFRLPSEQEWEYACRAGSVGRYCFGDDPLHLSLYAWSASNSAGALQQAGTRRPNAWGLHDMHGNVWEWCATSYAPSYAETETSSSQAPIMVIRGGDWLGQPEDCRASNRGAAAPVGGSAFIGMRLVMRPPDARSSALP